ncbi:hypothetical protein J6590_082964, partial [Homalodisca vitripennis]
EDEPRPTHGPQPLPIPHQHRARGRPRLARPNEQDSSNEDNTDSEDGTGWVEVDEENDNDYNHLFTFHEEPGIKHCPPRNSSPVDTSELPLPQRPGYDPRARFQPLIDQGPSYEQGIKIYFTPGKNLSIDESMGAKGSDRAEVRKTGLGQYVVKKTISVANSRHLCEI